MRRAFSFSDYRRHGVVLVITVAVHGCALYWLMQHAPQTGVPEHVPEQPEQWIVLQLSPPLSPASGQSAGDHSPHGYRSVSNAASVSDAKENDAGVLPLQAKAQSASRQAIDWDGQAKVSAKSVASKMEVWSRPSAFANNSASASSHSDQDGAALATTPNVSSLSRRNRHCVKKLPYLISCSFGGDDAEADRDLLDGMKHQNADRDAVTTMETPNAKH